MNVQEKPLSEHLQSFFGFDKFKGNQEEIIHSVLSGKDVFVIMPTGGGKSLCYQLPAMMLDGCALVISPLIALMKNQVDLIRNYAGNDDVAHFFNSSLNKSQKDKVRKDVLSGKTKLLYVAPESLVKEENINFMKTVNVSFLAVDEAHCISEWGHDFRPEYRRIREIKDCVAPGVPCIALTATATPKVQSDIVKTLELQKPKTYISSFNRTNLYYEVRPKVSDSQAKKQIIKFVGDHRGCSGIVYVQNRRTTEELAEFLRVNGVKAMPYHAGLDNKIRTQAQDDFLMERIDVIVATIAFGMGIDKPDIRFIVHYDIPKSIENYFQETGRAGRDGLVGDCLTFFSYNDVHRLEKLFRDKSASERERNNQMVDELVALCESSVCRRKFILNYFGERFESETCDKGCDNCRHPKEQLEVSKELVTALKMVDSMHGKVSIKYIVNLLMGERSKEIEDYKHDQLAVFGSGKDRDPIFWNSVLRNGLIEGLLKKDIEEFGLIKLTDLGKQFIVDPKPFSISLNHNFQEEADVVMATQNIGFKQVVDQKLLLILKDLRRKVAQKHDLPPYVIFQDPSLEEMTIHYPVSSDQFAQLVGVSKGKALRYGEEFSQVIRQYCEENDIVRPDDVLVKTVAKKSVNKVSIIKKIDLKISLDEIADQLNMKRHQIIQEIETIVNSGTKVDIDYCLEGLMDEYLMDEIFEYFKTADSDSIDDAMEEFSEDELEAEDIQLVRIKFLSEMAN